MKSAHVLLTAAFVLAACDQPAATAPQPETATPTTGQGKPGGTAAPAANTDANGNALTPAMFVGRWGDNGDCTKDIAFNADGTFRSYTGGSGTWTLNGDIMSMTGQAGTFEVRVAIVDQNRLMIGNPDGSFGMSQRCQ